MSPVTTKEASSYGTRHPFLRYQRVHPRRRWRRRHCSRSGRSRSDDLAGGRPSPPLRQLPWTAGRESRWHRVRFGKENDADSFTLKFAEFLHALSDDTLTLKSATKTYRFKAGGAGGDSTSQASRVRGPDLARPPLITLAYGSQIASVARVPGSASRDPALESAFAPATPTTIRMAESCRSVANANVTRHCHSVRHRGGRSPVSHTNRGGEPPVG